MNIIEYLRKQTIEDTFNINTFRIGWNSWKNEIDSILGENLTANNILNLGDRLTEIFRVTASAGRDQGSLSSGGTAWEALVCYYINLCTINSNVVAIRKMSSVPKNIQDAITVNYGNFPCNTESDITILIFPNKSEYTDEIANVQFQNDNEITASLYLNNRINNEVLNNLIERDFSEFEIGIIQCKTNWNDNAQIPMLWDMIYSAGGFSGRNITIGRNNYSIQNCNKFTYSFVTVPSNNRSNYTSNSVAVKRVYNLSGGNYWGKSTETNVCRSIKEIFNNNYSAGFKGIGARGCITEKIDEFNTGGEFDYFKLL